MRDLRRKNEEVERERDESEKERERMRCCIEQLRTKLAQVTAQVASAQIAITPHRSKLNLNCNRCVYVLCVF